MDGSLTLDAETQFLSTPSGWRATDFMSVKARGQSHFYPRPPGGGRHCCREYGIYVSGISIHALRVEGDLVYTARFFRQTISIHALRVEGDR